MFLYPLKFIDNFHPTLWGGRKLKTYKGLISDNEVIGESWEVSVLPQGESVVSNGALKGRKLTELIAEYGAALLGDAVMRNFDGHFPVLIKFLDAARDLSIQVHPDNTLAKVRHDSLGKTEMWYVLAAEPGARLIAGLKENITPEEYEEHVRNNTICDVLKYHEVRPGNVYSLPAGRIHALGAGVMVAEVQQSSNITYRIYDYNRPDLNGRKRELHTDLAKQAIDYTVYEHYRTRYEERRNEAVPLVSCPYFVTQLLDLDRPMERRVSETGSFKIYMCLSGACRIEDSNGYSTWLPQGHTALVPGGMERVTVIPAQVCKVMEVYC